MTAMRPMIHTPSSPSGNTRQVATGDSPSYRTMCLATGSTSSNSSSKPCSSMKTVLRMSSASSGRES